MKRKYFVYKEMQSLRIFHVYNFFVERRSHVKTVEYFVCRE